MIALWAEGSSTPTPQQVEAQKAKALADIRREIEEKR